MTSSTCNGYKPPPNYKLYIAMLLVINTLDAFLRSCLDNPLFI